jgi:hypothetical protein
MRNGRRKEEKKYGIFFFVPQIHAKILLAENFHGLFYHLLPVVAG